MNSVWSYVVAGVLTLCAAAVVAGGEPAMAELRLAEAATTAAAAGGSVICFSAAPEPVAPVGKTPAID
jgi:hypothetical protein